MTNRYELEITAIIKVAVDADSLEDAETKVKRAYADVPPTLHIDGEDVLYDFSIADVYEYAI